MKRIILFRHGEAVPASAAGDHARALSKRGLAEASEAGAALMQQVVPDFALVSDALRTRQTFERVAAHFDREIPHRIDSQLYGAEPSLLLDLIAGVSLTASDLLIIGHNPGLSELARVLSTAGAPDALQQLAAHFPTSAFAVIALGGPNWAAAPQGGTLERFYAVDCSHPPT